MKKLILSLSIIALGAMTTNAQVTFGGQAGLNLGTANWKQTVGTQTTTYKFKAKAGLIIGLLAHIPVSTSIAFRPELNFIQKGGKYSDASNGTLESTLNYIELPLNFVYSAPAGSGTVFFGIGPSLGLGLSGKDKYSSGSTSTSTTVKFDGTKNATDNNDHFKAIDFGGNLIAGYQLASNWFASIGYCFGLTNINPDDGNDTKLSGFHIKLGYMFGGKKDKK